MDGRDIRLGVVGCGGFGLFALQHFVQVPGVSLAAVAGTRREEARTVARRFGVTDLTETDALLARRDIDLVYLATPPFLHHPGALEALQAGKHVLCEKPLALTLAQGKEMRAEADRRKLVLSVNLMQRYNPVFASVRRLVEERVLGDPLHGFFLNEAGDEGLQPSHWFWDRAKSGGIFVEHGVHFFDLLAGWLGKGEVVAATSVARPDSGIEEQVQCTVRYPEGVLVNFHHAFCHPGRMDRQELRLVFERGEVTLYGWIPTQVRIQALADEAGTRILCELFPGSRLDVTRNYPAPERACRGRHKAIDAGQLIELVQGEATPKLHRYGELLRALMADLAARLRDPAHRPLVTVDNGLDSLALAEAAAAGAAG